MRNLHRFPAIPVACLLAIFATTAATADPGDPVHETCPSAEDVGTNVTCYPVTFTSKTEIHPEGIPIIGYLFVPNDRPPGEPLPAIVFAHGSGSMYSDGNHNKGLNSKHKQWVRQYTNDLGIVSLHVSSFHSRYLLPDTEGDQRILDIDVRPEDPDGVGVGGDDYRATSSLGYEEDEDGNVLPYTLIPFDPERDDFNDHNKRTGVSEVMERAYDMDAAWDFLAGIRKGRFIPTPTSRNDDVDNATLGMPLSEIDFIGDMIADLVIDHERIFLYGTSHGGQTAMAAAHAPRALGDANPMNAELPSHFNRRRYAAFFDYYGGCGLFGAYGGADDDSTWRPYAPFLMLHGEADDIWVDNKQNRRPTTREDWFENSECENRIAAAKADPGFEQFLEAIVYEGAEHSFDGVKRGDVNGESDRDFAGWLAKIHANYRMTLPFMEATGWRVAARRNNRIPPNPTALGNSDLLPVFDTFPLTPNLPPQLVSDRNGTTVFITDLTDSELDLATLLHDPFDLFDMECELSGTPENIGESDECVIHFALTTEQTATGLPVMFWIQVGTERGEALIPVVLETEDGASGRLVFKQEFHALPVAASFNSLPDPLSGDVLFHTDAFVWTRFRYPESHQLKIWPVNAPGFTVSPTHRFLQGDLPASPITLSYLAYTDGNAVQLELQVSNTEAGAARIDIGVVTPVPLLDDDGFDTEPLPIADFLTNFVPLAAVSDIAPLPPGQFPDDGDDDSGDDDSGDDDSGDDDSGDDDSGDDDSGDDDSGDDDSGDDDSGDDDSGDDDSGDDDSGDDDSGDDDSGDDDTGGTGPGNPDNGSGGGGAFFWLLPFAMLLRRR